jgi:hypothetical protein
MGWVAGNKGSGASATLTVKNAGDTLLLGAVSQGASGSHITAVSDGVNTWSKVTSDTSQFDLDVEVWVAEDVAAGATTVTITWSSGSNELWALDEYTGVPTSGVVLASAHAGGHSATTTGSQASGSIVYGYSGAQSGGPIGAGAGFTLREQGGSNFVSIEASEDQTAAGTGTQTAAFSAASTQATIVVVLAAGGGSVNPTGAGAMSFAGRGVVGGGGAGILAFQGRGVPGGAGSGAMSLTGRAVVGANGAGAIRFSGLGTPSGSAPAGGPALLSSDVSRFMEARRL